MKTIYDFLSMGLFAGLAILYLQRSASPDPDPVPLWRYAVAALGCAVANYLGNHELPWASAGLLVGVCVFALVMLKPFDLGASGE